LGPIGINLDSLATAIRSFASDIGEKGAGSAAHVEDSVAGGEPIVGQGGALLGPNGLELGR
jgi:hypothetical protein